MLKMQGEHQKVDNITYKECNRKTTEFYNIIIVSSYLYGEYFCDLSVLINTRKNMRIILSTC